MNAIKNKEYCLGKFLKELRQKKGVSLRDVEQSIGIASGYLSQLETGNRQKLPSPTRLRKLAGYYNVTVQELLQSAGYIDAEDIVETREEKIEKAFLHAITDANFHYGTRLKNSKQNLDTKLFIIEMYEKITNKKILD